MGGHSSSTTSGCPLPSSNYIQTSANLATVVTGRATGSAVCGPENNYSITSSRRSSLPCCRQPLLEGVQWSRKQFSSTATTTQCLISGNREQLNIQHSCTWFGDCFSWQPNNNTVLLKNKPGVDNSIANSLSPSQLHRFRFLALGADAHATPTHAVKTDH